MLGIEHLHEKLQGRYAIERELGRGGMATVYLARDLRHARRVALKVLHPELAAGIGAERFRAEIDIAAALVHPGILPLFDSGGAGDELFYVMPYIEGESLRARLTHEGRLPLADALRIASDVGEALAYAHARDIVHRDIKPENILLVEGRAVVSDFGIARAIAKATQADRLTVPGVALGTPLYMSPEQASGDQNVDGRSDVYSLACVLFEMLAGVAPHSADTPREVLQRKFTPESFSQSASSLDVPLPLQHALIRALSPDPAERFATAAEFVAAINPPLGRLRRSSGWIASRVGSVARERRWMRIAGATAVVSVTAVGALSWRLRTPPLESSDGRIALAVLPFRATVREAAQWTEAIPDLLATALDGTPGVRVVDPWALWRQLRNTPEAAPRIPDPREAARLTQGVHACCFVLGSVAQLNDRLEVTLRLYRRGTDEPWHTISDDGAADSVSDVVQRLAVELIRRVADTAAATALADFDKGVTRSSAAMKAWLLAREMRRRGQIDSAENAISRALALDSNFVLALVDAVSIRSWAQFQRGEPYSGLIALAQRAASLSDSLPGRASLRAKAMLASVRTDGAAAVQALDHLLTLDSADVDAWSLLSYVHTVYGWQYGRSEADAIRALEQGLRLDPTDISALVRRAHLAVGVNDVTALDRLVQGLRATDTLAPLVRAQLRAVQAVRASDAEFASLLGHLREDPTPVWIAVLRMLRIYRPDRAERHALAALESSSVQAQRVALGAIVQLWSAEGRWRAIDSLRGTGIFAVQPNFDRLVQRVATAAAISGTADDETARHAAASLAAMMNPDSATAWLNSRPVWLEGWLIGAYHAMYGDTLLAHRWQRALGSLPRGGSPERYGEALQEDVLARLASRRGDRRTALVHADRAMRLWTIHTDNQLELMPEPAMRFHLAALLRAAGRTDSASALFRSLVPPTTWMGFYTARAALEAGELNEARGRRNDAFRYYLMALRLLENGDPAITTFRDRARRGVERLSS